jgi:ABC-type amino acid transport substrate-binding protein
MFRQTSSFVILLTCGAVLGVGLAGCGEEPTPPRLISISPAVLTVPADEAIAISVEYEENDFALQDFRWTVEAGEIEGNGAPSITYQAPADPGEYKITVAVAYGEDAATLSMDSVVKVTAPVATTAPPVAEASEPATTAPTQPTERATTTVEQPAEATAAATGTATEEAVAATEEAPPSAATEQDEGAPEQTESTAAASMQAVEEAAPDAEATPSTAAPVAAVEEATPPAAPTEGATASQAGEATDQAAQRSEQPAPATAAGVPEGSKEPARDVAAVADETGGEGQGAGREPTPVSNAPAPAADEATPAAEPAPEVAALTEATTTASAGSRLDQILDRHRLTAVVQIALKPFSFYGEDGRRTGFEIDFLREFARRWLDDPTAVTFLPVPTDARIPTLQKGRADLIGAALTKTPARAEEVDFSLTYFKDGQRLLVPEDSAVADVCDLKGKKVAAIHGSTSLDNVKAAAAKCGFELGANLVTFRRHDDAIEALLEGQIEAYTSDGVALESIAEDRPLKVVGNHFSEEPYGFAVRKGDQRLLELINRTLEEMARDGTYAAIYDKWFGDAIRPYPLEESETVAATEVAALATTSAPPIVEPKTAPAEPVETYVVQAGDTLSRIAGKVYGDVSPRSWQRIYQANREVIGDDPSRIKVGMTLTIPQ